MGEYLGLYQRAAPAYKTTMTSFRSFMLLLCLALTSVLSIACTRPSEKASDLPAAPSPTPAARSAPTTVTKNAALDIQQIEAGLLRFAASLEQPGDMSHKRVEEMLGIKFDPPKDLAVSRRVLRSLPLANGYTLYVSHSPEKKGFSFINLLIGLPDKQDPTRILAATCVWDAADFSAKLGAMGYKRGGQRPFQGGTLRQHWRAIHNGAQGFSVALLIYETTANGASRECVYGVQIDGGDA
ncbi:hypothetical protein VC273_00935 [Xanthomonas nasturtii]|uniref:hypothetical protein n=1 Tax=Xanthomonas TaxID=338 RepID=UPI002B2380CF|nr:hypothetical protein [Xanthomonas nasturtii]MEA9554538.1 hypothetical protein [Xanthomonas nasturtii]